MELQGKIKMIDETKTYGTGGFRKREMVITTEEQYPQEIMVEFVQDKSELLNSYSVGQDVKISINLRGRAWVNPEGETKYFNSIVGWRIENLAGQPSTGGGSVPPMPPVESFESTNDYNNEDQDDLPF